MPSLISDKLIPPLPGKYRQLLRAVVHERLPQKLHLPGWGYTNNANAFILAGVCAYVLGDIETGTRWLDAALAGWKETDEQTNKIKGDTKLYHAAPYGGGPP